MRKYASLALLAIAMIALSCSSSKQVSDIIMDKQKLNGRSFQKLFILVATKDIEVRNKMENELVAISKEKGYAAVKSLDMLPFSLETMKMPVKEEIEASIKETGSDALLLISISRTDAAVTYTPAVESKNIEADAWGSLLLGILNKDFNNQNRQTETVKGVYVPGHYEKGKVGFVIQGNLCDGASEEVLCTVPGKNIDLSKLNEESKSYAGYLVTELEKAKLLAQKK